MFYDTVPAWLSTPQQSKECLSDVTFLDFKTLPEPKKKYHIIRSDCVVLILAS